MHTAEPNKIAFIGVGNMGRPLVERLLLAGYEVQVYDIDPTRASSVIAAGARWKATPALCASGCGVVVTCLPLPHHVLENMTGPEGALAGMAENSVWIDTSTTDYHNTRHIAGCGFACADYDTMQISRALFPAQRHHRLADLIVRFGIADNEEHRALSDAIQTQQCFEWMRHYVTEHHESEAIRWKQAPAKNSAEILHQQLVVKR